MNDKRSEYMVVWTDRWVEGSRKELQFRMRWVVMYFVQSWTMNLNECLCAHRHLKVWVFLEHVKWADTLEIMD